MYDVLQKIGYFLVFVNKLFGKIEFMKYENTEIIIIDRFIISIRNIVKPNINKAILIMKPL